MCHESDKQLMQSYDEYEFAGGSLRSKNLVVVPANFRLSIA